MRTLKILALLSLGLLLAPRADAARIGVEIGVGPAYVGAAPVCAYGYYDYYPYACAPYGFYGSEWFSGGVFIGAGPWSHGYRGFHGNDGRPGFYAGRGFDRGPVVRDRGSFGRMPAEGSRPAFRGDFHGNAGGHFDRGNASHGGNGFHGGGNSHSGGSFHGGGHR